MDYKTLTELYLQVSNESDVLLNNNDFLRILNGNQNLMNIMIDRIAILKFLETKLSDKNLIKEEIESQKKEEKKNKEKTSKSKKDNSKEDKKENKTKLIELKDLTKSKDIFNQLKKISISIDFPKEKVFTKIEDVKDSINYLNVYLKNTIKKDINVFLVKNKTDKKIETATAEKVSSDFSGQQQNVGGGFFGGRPGPNMGGGFGNVPPHMSQEAFKESYLYTLANQRLNQDILSGKFYKFKTKPKEILIIKKIIACLFWLIALVGVISLIIYFLVSSEVKIPSTGSDSGNSSSNQSTGLAVNMMIFNSIFVILYTLIYVYIGYTFFKNEKNENRKYDFQKIVLVIFSVIFVLQLFSLIQETVNFFGLISRIQDDMDAGNTAGNTVGGLNLLKTYTYLNVIQNVLYVFVVVSLILALFFAPKLDTDRINLKLKEYVDEMRNQI